MKKYQVFEQKVPRTVAGECVANLVPVGIMIVANDFAEAIERGRMWARWPVVEEVR